MPDERAHVRELSRPESGSQPLAAYRARDAGASRVDPRQLAFGFDPPPVAEDADTKWAWLMAVETDAAGRALRVVFFQANALGQTQDPWIAPLGEVAEVRALAAVRARTPRRGSATRASLASS